MKIVVFCFRYTDILQELGLTKDDVIAENSNMPEKRGRSRHGNTSGFYSNW